MTTNSRQHSITTPRMVMCWRSGGRGDGQRDDGGCSGRTDYHGDADAAVTSDSPPTFSLPFPLVRRARMQHA